MVDSQVLHSHRVSSVTCCDHLILVSSSLFKCNRELDFKTTLYRLCRWSLYQYVCYNVDTNLKQMYILYIKQNTSKGPIHYIVPFLLQLQRASLPSFNINCYAQMCILYTRRRKEQHSVTFHFD